MGNGCPKWFLQVFLLPARVDPEIMAEMKRRIALPALVGIVTFVSVVIEFMVIHRHLASVRPSGSSWMPGFAAPLYGVLFGVINAAVTFGVGLALQEPSDLH
jgi:hypothetical protein